MSRAGGIHLFVSPHYDDIALSCGGTVARLVQAGRRAEVAVVFGAQPDAAAPLTPFAEMQHDRWGVAPEQVITARRAEEAAAAALLGTQVSSLPFHDAIYRGSRYLDDDQLFGETAADEADLPEQLVRTLALERPPDPAVRIYCPLAIAGHVDHRHTFAAGVALARSGWDVCFYEDQPYALRAGATEERLAEIAALGLRPRPPVLVDVETTWATKLAAMLEYRSQLPVIFRAYLRGGSAVDEIDAAMRAYARRVGAGVLAERFWQLTPAA